MDVEATIARFLAEHLHPVPGEYVDMERVWTLWRKWPDRVVMPEARLREHLSTLGHAVEDDALLGFAQTAPKPKEPPKQRVVRQPHERKGPSPYAVRIAAEMLVMGIVEGTWKARYAQYVERRREARKEKALRPDSTGWQQAAYRRKVRATINELGFKGTPEEKYKQYVEWKRAANGKARACNGGSKHEPHLGS